MRSGNAEVVPVRSMLMPSTNTRPQSRIALSRRNWNDLGQDHECRQAMTASRARVLRRQAFRSCDRIIDTRCALLFAGLLAACGGRAADEPPDARLEDGRVIDTNPSICPIEVTSLGQACGAELNPLGGVCFYLSEAGHGPIAYYPCVPVDGATFPDSPSAVLGGKAEWDAGSCADIPCEHGVYVECIVGAEECCVCDPESQKLSKCVPC